MKKILLPTDFSDVSDNAIRYAVEIAKLTGASLTLLHVYHVPVVTTDMPVVMPTLEDLEKDCLSGLEKIKQEILSHNSGLNVDCKCECGLVVDEMEDYLKVNSVDLIVVGTQGAGYLSEKLLGSVTTSLIKKVKVPVLIIDREVRYKPIKKIALACDYKEISNATLSSLKEFGKLFNAKIFVVNVVREEAEIIPTTDEAAVGVKIDHLLEDIEHSYHYAQNDDVVEGVNDFVQEHNIDLIVMIPRQHSGFRNLFHEAETKRMAFHTHTPFLSLHE